MKKFFLIFLLSIFLALTTTFFACKKIDIKYKVDFVVDGEVVATVGTDSETIKMPKNPTKEGYSFEGWYWDDGLWYEEFTLVSIAEQPLRDENNFKVYAKFKSTEYFIVQFDCGIGTGEMPDQQINVGVSTPLNKMTFTAPNGYVFDGWEYDDNTYADEQSVIDLCEAGETIKLYAKWRIASYTINYNANGGTGTIVSDTQSIKSGIYPSGPYSLTAPKNKEFVSWNTKADGTGINVPLNKETFLDVKDGDVVTLYAQWKVVKYTVKFKANGGSGTMSSRDIDINEQVSCYSFENQYTAPNIEKEFCGWNTKADGSGIEVGDTYVSLQSLSKNGVDVTLYAQWRYSKFYITLHSNDERHKTNFKTVSYESDIGVYYNDFYVETYLELSCWNTRSDGSGINLTPTQVIPYLRTQTSQNNIDLFAQWTFKTGYSVYNISSVEDFALLNGYTERKIFNLKNDIDCQGASLTPINWGNTYDFNGIFVGNGYVISNFLIGSAYTEPSSGRFDVAHYGSSFFGDIGRYGEVHRLGLENFTCTGRNVASFAINNGGLIRNCYSNGTIIGEPYNTNEVKIGGIAVDSEYNGTSAYVKGIQNCYFYGELIGSGSNLYTYGISGGKAYNCLTVCSVTLEGENVRFYPVSDGSNSYCYYYDDISVIINNVKQNYKWTLEVNHGDTLSTTMLNNADTYIVETDKTLLKWSADVWDFSNLDVENGKLPKLKKQL